MRSLDQVDIKDKSKLLKLVKEQGFRLVQLSNENNENILHISKYEYTHIHKCQYLKE